MASFTRQSQKVKLRLGFGFGVLGLVLGLRGGAQKKKAWHSDYGNAFAHLLYLLRDNYTILNTVAACVLTLLIAC